MKRRDRKLPRYFRRLDARPQPGEPAAGEASEQKNRHRFRTGKVRTGWWRWCLGDWWSFVWGLLMKIRMTWFSRTTAAANASFIRSPINNAPLSSDQHRATEPGICRVLLRCLIQDSVHFLLLRHPGHHRNRRPRTCGTGLPGTEPVHRCRAECAGLKASFGARLSWIHQIRPVGYSSPQWHHDPDSIPVQHRNTQPAHSGFCSGYFRMWVLSTSSTV